MMMYRGDLKPDLSITLTDAGLPQPLTDALSAKVTAVQGGSTLFSRPATISDTDMGLVVMEWLPGDTDQVGVVKVEVEVMWPGNKPQTFRPDDVVTIVADYG